MAGLTVTTKRMVVVGLIILPLAVIIGWIMGSINTRDAMLVVGPVISGFFGWIRD